MARRETTAAPPLMADTKRREVTYIARGGSFEIPEGFCVMSLAPEGEDVARLANRGPLGFCDSQHGTEPHTRCPECIGWRRVDDKGARP